MSEKLSFTITFSEEDMSLLSFLQTFPSEQWEGLIKKALRVYVAKYSDSDSLPQEEGFQNTSQAQWSLEELFVAPHASEPESQNALSEKHFGNGSGYSEASSDNLLNYPLSHLFNLIGEEKDDEVLALLLGSKAKQIEVISRYSAETNEISSDERSLEIREDNVAENNATGDYVVEDFKANEENRKDPNDLFMDRETLQSKDVAGSKGLAFILNQVIGEEEDPEVLKFFRDRKA